MQHHDDSLGEFCFSTGKSALRLTGWTVLILMPVVLFLLTARGNLEAVTGNEIAISIILMIFTVVLLLNFVFTRIDVYSKGLVQKRFFSKQPIPFNPYMQLYVSRWRYGIFMIIIGKISTLTIESEHFTYRIPTSFRQNEKIIEVIENYLFKESMHMLNQTYDAGEVLHFGAIQLSREHLSTPKQHIPTSELSHHLISNGKLKIYTKNKKGSTRRIATASVPLDKIANFRLLCRFIALNDSEMPKPAYRIKRIFFL